jgi:hypothetical protein
MGHLSDIMSIMFGFLVNLAINRKLHISAISYIACHEVYTLNYPFLACHSWICATKAY